MKVNIGPYPKKPNGISRKIDVQIDSYDTWSLDVTLAHVILPALLQIKEQKQGTPGEFTLVGGENYIGQDSFDFYKESHNDAFELGCERWNTVLDKMIWSFHQIISDDLSEKYQHGTPEYEWAKSTKTYTDPVTKKQEPMYTMVDLNPTEHWHDYVGQQLHEDRIQEGLELFGKYYRSLWD